MEPVQARWLLRQHGGNVRHHDTERHARQPVQHAKVQTTNPNPFRPFLALISPSRQPHIVSLIRLNPSPFISFNFTTHHPSNSIRPINAVAAVKRSLPAVLCRRLPSSISQRTRISLPVGHLQTRPAGVQIPVRTAAACRYDVLLCLPDPVHVPRTAGWTGWECRRGSGSARSRPRCTSARTSRPARRRGRCGNVTAPTRPRRRGGAGAVAKKDRRRRRRRTGPVGTQ